METITKQYGKRTSDDVQHDRAVRMTQVVQKFASTLCQRQVRTRLVPEGVAPAWSTSNTITFAEEDLADLGTVEGVLSSKGLSLHEVCHILFTPRSGTDIVRWVVDNGKGRAFNALEDQRIETLMVGRFGDPVVPWLTAVVAQHLVSKPEQLQTAFPLIRGRKYLPLELRQACRDLYAHQEDVAELSSIIDEYRLLLYPQDTQRGIELITRYAQLIKGIEPEGGCSSKSPDSYDSNADSRPISKRAQESARSKAEARDEEDDEDNFDFGDPADSPADETDNEQSGAGDEADTNAEDESQNSSGNGDSDSDGAPAPSTGSDTGSGSDSASDSSPSASDAQPGDGAGNADADKLADLLNDILDEQVEKLAEDLSKDIAKYNGEQELVGGNSSTPRIADFISGTVDETVVRASKSFGTELERLRAQFDPGWEREVSSGRINASRYLRGCELDEAFDRWSVGRDDAVDIEAVIVLDASGSMGGEREQRASNAMWGLKRALDRVGANCTVVTFQGYAGGERLLYKADEPASTTVKRVQTGGGTEPIGALKYATRVLAESSRAIKVLFNVTDGEWSSSDESDKLIRTMRQAGVLTAMAYIAEWEVGADKVPAHECEVVSHIANSSDLFVLGRQLVKLATARNLAR